MPWERVRAKGAMKGGGATSGDLEVPNRVEWRASPSSMQEMNAERAVRAMEYFNVGPSINITKSQSNMVRDSPQLAENF